jgi:hypothetical protein
LIEKSGGMARKKLYVLVKWDKILKDYSVVVSDIKPPFPLYVPILVNKIITTKNKKKALKVAKETAEKIKKDGYDVEIIRTTV